MYPPSKPVEELAQDKLRASVDMHEPLGHPELSGD
jgi:hypothetical protein